MAFSPAEPKANGQSSSFCRLIDAAWIICDIKTWNSYRPSGSGQRHQRVQDCGRSLFFRILAVPPCLKTDTIDGAINLGHTEYLIDLICHGSLKRNVNSFATE